MQPTTLSDARRRGGSPSQTATRVLVMMDALGDPVGPNPPVPNAVARVASLIRVQKLDFWMRNPDYLADELLTDYEGGLLTLPQIQDHVVRMLDGDAPSLHSYPMERYLYGAYEFIDNALAVLKFYGQIDHHRAADSGNLARRDYYLLDAGRATVRRMRAQVPQLEWYYQQTAAIALLADASTGTTARNRQYEQPEYENARHGEIIPSILERVRERAVQLSVMKGTP
ncbi:hypothetical protein LC082_07950 [Microbacterium esteraromaticum]|uniref:hypothetical protein n=1 Tax=Microbacterium esteraromaticum TaxID=57043 RepID=UPI001CD40C38|nr:hypothetical protein [Microbacterium esteraromaticum]MCA1306828.1 hypothetical protein [Microbacterium esteraromaticum]